MVTRKQVMDILSHTEDWPSKLVAMLTVDELQTELDTLRKQNAELQHRIVELELALRSERDSHVLYMNLYTEEMQKAVKHDRR